MSGARSVRGRGDAVEVGRTIFLRYLTLEDRGEYCRLRRASEDYLRPWEPEPSRPVSDRHEFFFMRDLEQTRCDDSERLLACRVEDGAIAGRVSINQIFRGPLCSCILGYWVGQPFAGRGYCTEAVGLTVRHAFGRLGLHRCEANIMPHNEASRRVVIKNGFRCEGLSLRYLMINGAWRDHERWAVTAEDLEASETGQRAASVRVRAPG